MSFEEIVNLIGKPQTKSSEVASVWLNDDGAESWYCWTLPLKQTEHLYLEVKFYTEQPLINAVEFRVFIFQEHKLFYLFDEIDQALDPQYRHAVAGKIIIYYYS
ncbi:unnamed protein product [Rotaria socialis]